MKITNIFLILMFALPALCAQGGRPNPNRPAPASHWEGIDWKTVTAGEIQARLDAGAEVNAANKYGQTALMFAADYTDDLEIITALIAAGANVNASKVDGWTALMYAIRFNTNPAITTTLIAAGADVNAADTDGWTVLMVAVGYSSPALITALIAAGANPHAENTTGATALDLARATNPANPVAPAIIKILEDNEEK